MIILYNDDLYAYKKLNNKAILEYLKENGIDPTPNATEAAALELINIDYEDLIYNIKRYDEKNENKIYIDACLGLWRGRVKGFKIVNNLYDAIVSCCEDINIIYFDNLKNTLRIGAQHHDGLNEFKIYKLVNGHKKAIKYNDLIRG